MEQRRADPSLKRGRFELSDDLILDISDSIRKAKPRVTDDELEAVFAGVEKISREAAERAELAKLVEASHAPRVELATKLHAVDTALSAVSAAAPDSNDQRTAVEQLEQKVRATWVALEHHGLGRGWQDSVAANPLPMREILSKARRAAGPGSNRLAEIRREREIDETILVTSGAARLSNELFSLQAPPDGFADFAARAVAEVAEVAESGEVASEPEV